MPLDGVFLTRLRRELAGAVVGGRVDKIHQPARETIVIAMRARAGNRKLLLSASASNPRVHFTELAQDNPKSPPMFCMLMRKHLTGAKLVDITQAGLDRILHFHFETTNELGDRVVLTLSVEIMGRHSNIILVDQEGRIIDAVKRVSDEMSRVRPVLPGMMYTHVPAGSRLDIYKAAPSEIVKRLHDTPEQPLYKALISALEGMSPLVCREIAWNAARDWETPVSQLDGERETRLKFYLSQLSDRLNRDEVHPVMLVDAAGKPSDFTYIDINQYGHTLVSRDFDTYSALLDSFYSERDRIDRMRQRGAVRSLRFASWRRSARNCLNRRSAKRLKFTAI